MRFASEPEAFNALVVNKMKYISDAIRYKQSFSEASLILLTEA